MGTALKDFKIKESYARLIEKALFSYFFEGVFKPMLEVLNIPLKAINADEDVITKGLLKGSIVYEQNGFKAIDKFTNAQSNLLRKWGAIWDKWSKSWKLPYSKLPQHILVAIAANKNLTNQKVDYLKKFLEQLQANWETAVQTMTFHEEVKTVLDDAGNEIQKVFKRINVIEPELSEEDKKEIARTYTNNMNFYVKNFGDERIPLMREKVQEIVLNGGRFQDVEKMLNREFEVWGNKAKFLSQNETNIMLAELKKVEYQKQGFDMFIWRTITDGRERELHRHLNGRVFRYDDPPIIDLRTGQRGLPGQTYNCRCEAIPYTENTPFKHTFVDENGKEREVIDYRTSKREMDIWAKKYNYSKG
jgi:SPP1 gp7 family putative phage head morphogenesis protein